MVRVNGECLTKHYHLVKIRHFVPKIIVCQIVEHTEKIFSVLSINYGSLVGGLFDWFSRLEICYLRQILIMWPLESIDTAQHLIAWCHILGWMNIDHSCTRHIHVIVWWLHWGNNTRIVCIACCARTAPGRNTGPKAVFKSATYCPNQSFGQLLQGLSIKRGNYMCSNQ